MNLSLAIEETKVTNLRPEIRIYQDTVSRDKLYVAEMFEATLNSLWKVPR